MATNFEFYVEALIETLSAEDPKKCSARTAQVALGMEEADSNTCARKACANCWAGILEILKQEHIEKPKLTKRERAFCEAVQTGWIARDCDMELCYFKNEPTFLKGVWRSQDGRYVSFRELNLQDPFMFIRDTDADCWSIEDLLKLEVQNETD